MIYRIVHKTLYEYADAVNLSHNLVRARPRNHSAQTCRWHELVVSPVPAIRGERRDYFGNHVSWLSLQEPHTLLTIESRSEVEVRLELRPGLSQGASWEQVAATIARSAAPETIAVRQFTFDSLYGRRLPELAAYALGSFSADRPLLECAFDLTRRIHADFKYLPGSTKVGTPSLEVLRIRKGVCQDFAHLAIGCLRSLGLAARYVSGYLVTTPPPGRPRLTGADASHAWISVFTPDFGWVDFDPTNGVMPLDSHITVAWGRDYDDVGPIRGILIGGQRQRLDVSVDVVPIENAN
ncbi:MAG: transglutaminase family protein [Candidatus Acidiferrales bacterium]|jgi:transglutaminase-like putative cysteine protease